MRLTWPLTGRDEELHLIADALHAPEVAGIVVRGASGVGKSRVAREALSAVAATGCPVHWVVATTSAHELPLGAFASWAGSGATDSLHLVQSVIDGLTAPGVGGAAVVAVDDAPLLDDLSTFVLHRIVTGGTAKVLLTISEDQPIPAGLQDIWKIREFDRLDLQPLSRNETATLLATTLGAPVDPDAARRLWELTRGNVLYLRNIVEQQVADGRLVRQDGFWRWAGEPMLPPNLVEVIETRIGTLPARIADVVDILAVGEPINLDSLRRITDPDAVEQADSRGLITLEPFDDGLQVRLAHPLYREVRRRRAATTRLRRLRGLLAQELAKYEGPDDRSSLVRRATLLLDSDVDPDPDLYLAAALAALWLMDMPLADRFAEAAIRTGSGVQARLIRGFMLSTLSRGADAEAVLEAIAVDELSDADRGRLAFLRARNRLYTLGDAEGALAALDSIGGPIPASIVHAFHTVYWAAMGKPDQALEAATAFTLAELPEVASGMTAFAIVHACRECGRTAEALDAASAADVISIRGLMLTAEARVGALLLAGRVSEAQQSSASLRGKAKFASGEGHFSTHQGIAGYAALGSGQLDSAIAQLGSVVELMAAAGESKGWTYRFRLLYTMALAMRGRVDEATASLVAVEKCRHAAQRHLAYEEAIARGWVSACEGAVSSAIKVVLSAAEIARGNGQFAAEVMCLQTAAHFGDGSGADRLRELTDLVEGPRAVLSARFADALHAGDGGELAATSEDFEAMGDLVAAIDCAAHAALAYRRRDRRGAALSCATRAQALAQRCGANTPALRQAAEPLPLTDREREIIELLRQGLSTRAVAARLTLSTRTIEGHIYRAMAKTGTTSRDELAALLRHSASRIS
jgi:DNA-binding NarL/FixJ family response regulator